MKSLIEWTPRVYDRWAKHYDWFLERLFPAGETGRQRVLDGLSPGSILDVACGTGTLLAAASVEGFVCHGVDRSLGMLRQAHCKAPHAMLTQASFYDLPYPDGYFDYVVETNALGGVRIDVKQALSEMIRVRREGGEVRLADFGKPPNETRIHRLVIQMGVLIGDYPQDFHELFRGFGYQAEMEILEGQELYQFFGITKV